MSKKADETPMMKQYREARDSLEDDTLLFFRLGDFYEMFDQDAERGAALLGITLTKRHDMPMAGFPYHSADGYLTKLLNGGHKVAICEQLEAPQTGKLVKRGITRILTPGTVLEDRQLDAGHNHFLLAVDFDKKGARASWLDLSTGKFVLSESEHPQDFLSILSALAPREILVPEGMGKRVQALEDGGIIAQELDRLFTGVTRTDRPDFDFEHRSGAREVMESLGVMNLEGFGIGLDHLALGPAGALLIYAQDVLKGKPGNISRIEEYRSGETLLLDPATQRNLEVFKTSAQTRKGSLLDAMDQTVTSAGARLLESYLSSPECDLVEIHRRQSCVVEFSQVPSTVEEISSILKKGSDLERILGRLRNRLVRPRELGGLRSTIRGLPGVSHCLLALGDRFPAIYEIAQRIQTFEELCEILNHALEEELPADIKVDVKGEGGRVIRAGYNEEFDQLRELGSGGKRWILELEASEREKTGINNLKVKYNGAFGYFIEVTKANLHLVPDHYVRKQTMTNAERYYTEELRQKEKEIVNAEERAVAKEQELFLSVVELSLQQADALTQTAHVLAEIDLYSSWGSIMRDRDYCMPEFIDGSQELEIVQGRHPVVEMVLKQESLGLAGTHAFVPNDCLLSSGQEQISLITGPNMAGKSTFIRQVALITLMAQVGCSVPATSCRLGLVDRIFSRVGAGDELARGNSTFMVEMNETANILNNCTPSSLIILDEIGRGTSTYDGLSIAWAVVEHLHGQGNEGPKTLFATHYHELTRLAHSLPRLRNFSVAVKEWNDEIIFVRQVTPGASGRSFGIQVARLAGLPDRVVGRAKEILSTLEQGDSAPLPTSGSPEPQITPLSDSEEIRKIKEEPVKTPEKSKKKKVDPSQLELF
jgi:DNA mismatch repair protein MutS